ncbi:hypothetical protein HQ535_15645 [bacterium]|nr:hypothetical protein [bacterium]
MEAVDGPVAAVAGERVEISVAPPGPVPPADVVYLSVAELVESGLLQELNRRFLHPLGFALAVDKAASRLHGIWDCRDDPEGIVFADLSDADAWEKYNRVEAIARNRHRWRRSLLGWVVQPIGDRREVG